MNNVMGLNIKIKNKIFIVSVFMLSALLFTGCASDKKAEDDNRVKIVTTIFPPYDFAVNVAGEYANVTRLLKPGAESHTYEPTPQDIMMIEDCDLFIYTGGESDAWIDDILSSIDTDKVVFLKMTEVVDMLSEEITEGMETDEEEGEEEELDEHVWTSPENAIAITEAIAVKLCMIDPDNMVVYRKNADAYEAKLYELNEYYKVAMETAGRKEIIVGDRFPFRYLTHTYGLTYYAAFPGCSEDAQVSAKTLAFLIDKVKEDNIPVVFHIEFSDEKIADSIVEVTGAKKLELHSCHNLSQEEIDAGEDYISIMYRNLENLKEALN